MNKNIKILAIESSCDETAASVVENTNGQIKVLSNIINSQVDLHISTFGVVPEVAARAHIENILPVIDEALKKANTTKDDIDALAVTVGPGLIGSLLVGVNTAKTLAWIWEKPIYAINHLYGHLYAAFIEHKIEFPAVILTASGGHTALVLMTSEQKFRLLGQTLDDAAGEAFDKVAKMLGLGYPGGPEISKSAAKFDSKKDSKLFPRPLLSAKNYDFSFSGLKTAVLYEIKKNYPDLKIDDENYRVKIAYEFEQALTDVLVGKAIRAGKEFKAKTIILSGGVAANKCLREKLLSETQKNFSDQIVAIFPSLEYCTDNAAMIGAAAIIQSKFSKPDDLKTAKADPALEL